MKKIDKKIENFLITRGYCHEEEQKVTYKCSSHDLKRYQKHGGDYPKGNPEGDAEFTDTITRDVADEYTMEELELITRIETEKNLRTIRNVAIIFAVFIITLLLIILAKVFNMI